MTWMNVRDAAGYAKVCEKTIYAAIERGALKAARIGAGRNIRLCAEWLDEWLMRSVEQPNSET